MLMLEIRMEMQQAGTQPAGLGDEGWQQKQRGVCWISVMRASQAGI